MRQLATFLLVLLIFLQTFGKMWVVVSFKIRQDHIAETLCIEKKIATSTCRGRCYLKEQLNKASEKEQKKQPTNPKEKAELVVYLYPLTVFEYQERIDFYLPKINVDYEKNFYPSSFIIDIFHPPKFHLV
jgi:hypothetical protein